MPCHRQKGALAGWIIDGQCRPATVRRSHRNVDDTHLHVQGVAPGLVDIELVGSIVVAEVVTPAAVGIEALVFHLRHSRPAVSHLPRGTGNDMWEVYYRRLLLTMTVSKVNLRHHVTRNTLL